MECDEQESRREKNVIQRNRSLRLEEFSGSCGVQVSVLIFPFVKKEGGIIMPPACKVLRGHLGIE